MNWAEHLDRCKAGAFGPDVRALFSDSEPDLAVQLFAAFILAKPAEEQTWFLERIKQEQRMRVLSNGLQGVETAPA